MAKLYTRSFNGGIISPEMWGRVDDLKANTGLATCQNFIVLPQGPISARTGLRFVREVKDSSKFTRLIPFRYSATQTVMLELGEAYIRFHSYAATLLTPTTGLSAYSGGSTYDHGDLVTESGSTWYAVSDVPTSTTPSSNEYGAVPVVSATWSPTSSNNTSIPSGYTYEGTSLPAAVVGGKVAISGTIYTYGVTGYEEGIEVYGYIPSTVYHAYDGVASVSGGGYWFEMGTVYEIPSPFAETDLPKISFAQSGDVLTLVHPSYPPQELRRTGATEWALVASAFGSAQSAPSIASVAAVTATSPSDTQSYQYVATNVSDDSLEESVASSASSAVNQLFDTGAKNTITFSDAERRNVYKYSGGLYGYIGQTTATTLVDDNIAADISRTPPLNQTPFLSDYPRTVAYFEQRKVFAGTLSDPQKFWMTKTGTETNLDYSIPVRADDAISIKLAALESSTIRHAVPLSDLILLTDSAEWRVAPVNSESITPTTVSVRVQSSIGASAVQPVVVGRTIIYGAARGGHARGLGFDFEANSYVSVDLSLRAPHLFDYKSIIDISYGKSPVPIVWAVSSDGRLRGLTFVPEQQVYAWHTHETTNGDFECCAVVEEGDDSILYAVVKRTIDGSTVRYIEALASRHYTAVTEYIGLDSSICYSGASTYSFSGLDHLEGEEVYALVDGAVQGPFTVASGAITIDHEGSIVCVGLQIAADAETLPMVAEIEAYAQATVKNVSKVTLRVYSSGPFSVGENAANLTAAKLRTIESYGDPTALKSEEVAVSISSNWKNDGRVLIRTTAPLPLTVSSATLHCAFGG